jgi:prepilin-type N-terminal cleavage/methylation domain-containing protein/prepilin-type processing-associated H-X9-DG protein
MKPRQSGLTLLELLVVIAVMVVLAALLLPTGGPRRAKLLRCISNLRQLDVQFVLYASDNHGDFPMQVSVANGGTLEFLYSGYTFPHFEKLRSYGLQTNILICPFETNRQAAASLEALNDLALSYFVNVDASTNDPAKTILLGDRFLQLNGQQVGHGIFAVTTNQNLSWCSDFHARGGGFAFTDGHVEFVREKLSSILAFQPSPTNRFSIP